MKVKVSDTAMTAEKLKKRMRRRNNIEAWILLIPVVFILYIMVWRPTVFGFIWSFFRMRGYTVLEFCGFDNFVRVISHTQFWPTLWNTVQYVLWSLVVGFLPPLFIAVALNEMVHFRSTLRLLIYLPVVIPGIAAMLIWTKMYAPGSEGLFNMVLSKLGMESYQWLSDPKFTIFGIILFSTWKSFGGSMLLYYASLQGASTELYEAALIDGAGPIKRFWHISRPAVEGILILNLVRQIISVFQIMEQPMAMTGGGPNGASTSLAYQLYLYGFNSGGKGTGQAMALGVITFLILIVFTIFYFWVNKKVESRY